MMRAPDGTQHPGSHSSLDAKFSLCGILICVVACGVSLLTTSHTGEFEIILYMCSYHFFLSLSFL